MASSSLMPWVYILRCADASFYVGLTSNLDVRLQEHNNGLGGQYTSKRLPIEMVYSERFESTYRAKARERQLKRWTTAKKRALIQGDHKELKLLARRRVYRRNS